ncbi:MAG: hypothetical protein FH757_08740 [Alcanivorax sp.]|jgi:hypothetical protein|nr:hypothetical protein [Alcanivorax sp.]
MGFALQVPVLKTEMKNSSFGPLFVTRLNGATIMATCYSTPSSPFHILKAWPFEEVTGGRSLLTVAVIGKAALRKSQQA